MELQQPVALVTGAGSGIGRATAVALAARGYALVLAGRRAESLQQTGAALATPWLAVPADLGRPEQVQALVDAALARFSRVDVLVNAAGVIFKGDIDQHRPEAIADVLAVNAAGPANLVARLWTTFARQRSGCVVNISSIVTQHRHGGPLAYTVSKGALDMLTQCCAIEGRHCGLRAFSINPGPVETAMLRNHYDESAVPRWTALTSEQVAAVVVDCLEGRWDKRNGGTIVVTARQPHGERHPLLAGMARGVRRWALGQ
jgi:NAD(P)-dependent dehydrogenase (short-subunit alcohol dehydrogenase family)